MDNNSRGQQPPSIPESAASQVTDTLAALREDIANLAESVKRMATEQLSSSVEDVQQSVETRIRRNPTQAVLIAAGVGAVIAMLLTR
jgi:ElaB/YqjD/DUF883 family membrane-anchored ribosome-binding protein